MKIKRTISAFLTAVILLISNSVLAAPASQDIPTAPEETTPPQVITSDVPEPPDDFVSTGNGSWYSDGICHDSAEALGVDVNRAYLCENNNEYYGDLSEYVLENEYFIIDESLQGYLSNNISPEVFNKFMHQMVLGYEAMYDLTGQKPGDGAKVLMRDMTPECYTLNDHMHTHIPEHIICWKTEDIIGILKIIQELNAEDWWLDGAMHELGHIFEDVAPWSWAHEAWGSYFAWLAIMKNNAKIHFDLPENPNDELYEGFFDNVEYVEYSNRASFNDPLKYMWYINLSEHINSSNGDFFDKKQHYIVYLLDPIFEHFGWNEGWKILQNVFRSYEDCLYTPLLYDGNVSQKRIADFVDRCSHFCGINIKDYWLPATIIHYEIALTFSSTPHIVLGPYDSRVGDEIIFSVYNCPTDQNLLVFLGNGRGWTSKYINFSKGDNLNVSFGYQITEADIGYQFNLVIRGLTAPTIETWSNNTQNVRYVKKNIDFRHNLHYDNGTYSLNNIEITAPALCFQNINFKLYQCTPDANTEIAEGNVQMDNKGCGAITFDPVFLPTDNAEKYIKIILYRNNLIQEPMVQQLIVPASFVF